MVQRSSLIIIVLTLCFIACKKESDKDNFMRGKIDGTFFEYRSNLTANTPEASGTGVSDPTLRVKGYESGNGMIELFILSETSSIKAGVYPFTIDKNRSATYSTGGIGYYAGPPGIFSPGGMLGSGSITITEINKRHVSGSFEFTTSPTAYVITEGSFSINRQ